MNNSLTKNAKWDLSSLEKEKSFEEKRIDWKKETDNFISKWKDRNDYLENPEILTEALDDYEKWCKFYGGEADEYYYYHLKTQIDQNDIDLKAKFNNVEEFSKKIENSMQFFVLNIGKIKKEKQEKFLEYSNLQKYKHFLERIFEESEYMLSEKEEKIMNLKSPSSHSSWEKMLQGFLSKEEREVLDENENLAKKSLAGIFPLMNSQNKRVRDEAAKAVNEILEKHEDVAEAEINAILANKKVNDELRGMPRPDFSRHLSDDIDSKVIDSLIKTVTKRFDLSKRYYELKSKLLELKKLEYHERNVEYGKISSEYTYEESVNLVHRVFSNLDKKFADIFQRFIENCQIDVFPKKGKRDGAFCTYCLLKHPTYIMLNHTNKIDDVRTLAHELGHGINNELIKEKQNSLNFETPLSTAEVASTFMEDFVFDEMLKSSDDELRLSLMIQKLNSDVSSIFRQVACYNFETELHEKFRKKGYLSKKEIGEIFQKHMGDYMGDFVEMSNGSQNWWIYWSHIRTFFYVYSYASGLLISKSLQNSVKENPQFIENVKEFLSTGLSDSPKNIFKKLGIDIENESFWNKGLDEVEKLLDETEKLAKKLGKI